MEEPEELFRRKYEQLQLKLADEAIMKKVDSYLRKICNIMDCDVDVNFTLTPHLDHYAEYQSSDEYSLPTNIPTINLGMLRGILTKEKDDSMNVYIDPIYLEKNKVNTILDILVTTIDDDKGILLIPIPTKEKK